jgi:hypothetical protein
VLESLLSRDGTASADMQYALLGLNTGNQRFGVEMNGNFDDSIVFDQTWLAFLVSVYLKNNLVFDYLLLVYSCR